DRSTAGDLSIVADLSAGVLAADLSMGAVLSTDIGWILSVRDACLTSSRPEALAVPSSNTSATKASFVLTTWLASCFANSRSIVNPPHLRCPLYASLVL